MITALRGEIRATPSNNAPVPPSSPSPLGGRKGVLVTAFEPSGDDHAAVLIAELRRRHPSLPIYAWGGPKMQAAGAELVELTTRDAVMGVPGAQKIVEHIRINRRIDDWLDRNRIAVHVPVDSPDANFSIAALAKGRGARVAHLVAPQVWAWRQHRIKKLRRLTDMVMCVLPFEEAWFRNRGVPATFVGHPLFERPLDFAALDAVTATWPAGSPRIALMPGSRPGEIAKCFPLIVEAFRRIKGDLPDAVGVIPVTHAGVQETLRRIAGEQGGWIEGMHVVVGNTDAAIRWCDCALVASGTVTLQVAKQLKPMVTFYRFGKHLKVPFALFGGKVFKTRFFTLPNLIANDRAVTELVPYFGDGHDLAVGIYRILRQPGCAEAQRTALAGVVAQFDGRRTGPLAADIVERLAGVN